MADWFRLAAMVDRQMDRNWSEPVRVSPLTDGVAIPDRPPIEIRAILETVDADPGDVSGSSRAGSSRDWRARLSAGRARLRIHRDAYPDVRVSVGDAVCAIARPGRPWFAVLDVNDRDDTHLVLELGEK